MPEPSLAELSLSAKPRRLSISFWFRMRAVTAASLSPSATALSPCAPSVLAIAAHSWASFSSSIWVFGSAIVIALLHQHFLEEHVGHLDRRRRRVDARQEFLAQPIDAGRAPEVLDPELAQIDLERVDDARHHRLQARQVVGALELQA